MYAVGLRLVSVRNLRRKKKKNHAIFNAEAGIYMRRSFSEAADQNTIQLNATRDTMLIFIAYRTRNFMQCLHLRTAQAVTLITIDVCVYALDRAHSTGGEIKSASG